MGFEGLQTSSTEDSNEKDINLSSVEKSESVRKAWEKLPLLRNAVAAGIISISAGCDAVTDEDSSLNRAIEYTVAELSEKIDRSFTYIPDEEAEIILTRIESGEIKDEDLTDLHNDFKELSLNGGLEYSFHMQHQNGVWQLVEFEKGDKKAVAMDIDNAYTLASEGDDMYHIHNHPLAVVQHIFKSEGVHTEVLEKQIQLIRDGEFSYFPMPPSSADIQATLAGDSRYGETSGIEQHNLVVTSEGVWTLTPLSTDENSKDATNHIQNKDSHQEYNDLHYELLKPYSIESIEAFEQGDRSLIDREYKDRENLLSKMKIGRAHV